MERVVVALGWARLAPKHVKRAIGSAIDGQDDPSSRPLTRYVTRPWQAREGEESDALFQNTQSPMQ